MLVCVVRPLWQTLALDPSPLCASWGPAGQPACL